MTATTQDRNTPFKDGELIVVPVAAGVKIPAGTLVVAGATGFATPGSTATGLACLGMADAHVDNTAGADGAVSVPVRRGKAFKWANDTSNPVTLAGLGRPCFIVDNQTVAGTDGSNTRSPAGIVLGLDVDGVWVI
ncbi:hypothetical protein [Laribacter hongkongensis]|uniref:Uncharacterized protein n=3 Tax=Laribacter hongkongensis TaxID=168471 RepID=A0A248LHC3_9NEIS|nr:hypothetical protein [Laribacter hongkongensis]ASJ24150.1 hypothetical protein LHGZ1_1319 [Laribacter hongkongensis]MCG9060270.1 hypothetical protein [Laribacter hongkongensis]MCG9087351.1 hypothetical protein [Laribacter hongkongensis]